MELILKEIAPAAGGSLLGLLFGWILLITFDTNVKYLFNRSIENHKANLQQEILRNQEQIKAELQMFTLNYQERLKFGLQNQAKELELTLNQKLKFDEKILLDRYELIRKISSSMETVATNVNRIKNGLEVPDFNINQEMVSLTEVFEEISAHKWLLTDKFYEYFYNQGQLLINMANEPDKNLFKYMKEEYLERRNDFKTLMNEEFKIDQITR